MNDPIDLKPVLTFLSGLQKNNNKTWFEQNRPAYEKAKGLFENFVDQLIFGLRSVEDLQGLTAKDCVMRIYRDIRFSKDKTPYKINFAAAIGPGGRKSFSQKYYLHIEPRNASMVAGGLHEPDSSQLLKFRTAIDRDASSFKHVINTKAFKEYFGTVEGEKLKTAPQGFARDHPEIELLRMKEVVAVHRLSDDAVLSPDFTAHVLTAFKALNPFLDYLNSIAA